MLTQREWSAILVAAWQADKPFWWALRVAGGDLLELSQRGRQLRFSAEIYVLRDHINAHLFPRCPRTWTMTVRRSLARSCKFASDALWDGKPIEDVLKLMTVPMSQYKQLETLTQDGTLYSERDKHRAKEILERKRTKFVVKRDLSKWHDWKTVK